MEKTLAPASSLLAAAKLAAGAVEEPATNEKSVTVPVEAVPIERTGEDLTLTLGERSYRVRGLDKNNSFEVLRVNLRLIRRYRKSRTLRTTPSRVRRVRR